MKKNIYTQHILIRKPVFRETNNISKINFNYTLVVDDIISGSCYPTDYRMSLVESDTKKN